MNDQEINIAIAEARGAQPELVEWWAYKDTPDGGSICYAAQSKDEIEKWLASLPEGSWAKDYVPKAFYRWPNYCGDLNAMHDAEKILTDEQHRMFRNKLFFMTYCREGCTESMAERERVSAPPRNRAEAFLRTIGKWKEEK